jgi:neuropeptide FF receptor 2
VVASIFTIATLSVDRFLAIRHPMIFRRVSTSRTAIKLIVVIWVLSMLVMMPLLFMRQVDIVDIIPEEPLHFCVEIWPDHGHRQIYDIYLLIVVYFVPGIVITLAYGLIGKELWTEDLNLNRTESEVSKGMGKKVLGGRKRIAKMLIGLAVLFTVCWLPYHIVTIYLDYDVDSQHSKNFRVILPYSIFLGHSNSAMNPILYFYSSSSFRRFLFRLLKCKRRTRYLEKQVGEDAEPGG